MAKWKPTIGKWHDEDNYNMIKPTWRQMLDAVSEYEEAKEVQTVLRQLGHRNLTGDDIRMYVIGYLLNQTDISLKKYIPDSMIAKIHSFSSQSQNIYDYTALVLKECHISDAVIEEIIDEFQVKS